MTRSTTIIILLLSSFSLAGQTKDSVRFKLSIIQDSSEYLIDNNVIKLKREPFSFKVVMNRQVELCVNASFDSSIYVQAKKGKPSKNLKGLQDGDAMAVVVKNQDRDLGITKDAYNIWFYESESTHTFGEIEKELNEIICTIQVDKLNIVSYPKRGPDIAKNEVLTFDKIETDLFLVFVDRVYKEHPSKDHIYDSDDMIDISKVTCKVVWE